MNILLISSVAIGGAVGATARFAISLIPFGTLIANILGCFILGAVYEMGEWVAINPNARAMISVGIIGALTTFSTFTLETLNLLRKHEWFPAFLYMMLSIVIGFIACVLGIFTVRLISRVIDT